MNKFLPNLLQKSRAVIALRCLAFWIVSLASMEVWAQTSYTSTTATTAWNAARWNNSADASPYTATFTANNNVSFTSGTYTFAGMGSTTNVGNVTVAAGVTVNFTSIGSTFATGGAVRTFDVGAGGIFDFNGNSLSTAAGTGFIKTGDGVLGTGAGAFTGGFTLNAGTVVARGTTGLGSGGANTLTLNGGTLASNATRDFANTRFPGGISIGGNVQFGELSTVVGIASSTANLSFANNVSLGAATRTLTQGNNGTNTFSGVISNSGSGGLTFAANASTDGRFELTNTANTFTGDINVNGGEVRFTADGSMGNAANDIIIDGGRFAKASDSTTVTLGGGRTISIGDGAGTSISSPGSGTLIYNGVIANKSGETGSWAKQGGGILELGGVSTYTGDTAINNGTVRLTTGNDRLPTGTTVSLGQAASANLGTLDLNGFNQEIAGLNSVTGTNAAVNNNIVDSATAAILTLGGSGTYSFGDGSAANSGVIRGALEIVKAGAGQQTFGDENTYSGGTTVSAGLLKVTNTTGSATGTGNVQVSATSTILGSGVISPADGGTITVASTGRVAVGDVADTVSAKVLTFTPASGSITTTFENGSIVEFDLFSNAGDNSAINTAADILKTGGSLVFDPNVTLRVLNGNGLTFAGGDKWTLLDWMTLSGSVSGSSSQLNLDLPTLDSGLEWDVSQFFTNGSISVAIVPEPSRAVLLAFGFLGLVCRRRRHGC